MLEVFLMNFFSIAGLIRIPLIILVLIVFQTVITHAEINDVPDSAMDINPLLIGSSIPDSILLTVDGEEFDLNAEIAGKPTVLIFYRGGWCPYCSTQLGELNEIES